MKLSRMPFRIAGALAAGVAITMLPLTAANGQAQKRPNIVMLMTDDTGWNDFGAYSGGGKALGHPTTERRQDRRGGRDLHQLVRAGELHRRPLFLHYGAHSDPLGAVDCRRAADAGNAGPMILRHRSIRSIASLASPSVTSPWASAARTPLIAFVVSSTLTTGGSANDRGLSLRGGTSPLKTQLQRHHVAR